ncbi:MAG TPA: NAD(P)(+) transhydrogenase (Re/Si-specific) subunit beta, partial [Solirubrobacterales bacterium]|nr:NAD(P)(+) transhydrogenase (Re/Si-specific) subunit beta [Solirubrobacterales bacterium]
MIQAVLEPGGDAATALYIVAFSLFIIGIKQGTHPTTAKRGNLIAAGGMAIAVVTTLLLDGIGNWGLIALGLGIGTAVGVVASIRVQMTEMPQMVALYIVAFSLFIIGIKQGTHPTTAKRGNLIAAVGMAVAVITTLLLDGM